MKNIILDKLKEYAKDPVKVAVRYKNAFLTYQELDLLSTEVSKRIKLAIGNKRNCPIVIYQERGMEFIILILAVMKSHCYYVPMEKSFPVQRMKYVYKDLNAKLIVSTVMPYDVSDCNFLLIDVDEMRADGNDGTVCWEHDEDDLVYVMYTSGTNGYPKGVKIKYVNLYNLIQSFWKIVYHKFSANINVGVIASFSFDASVKQIFGSLFYGHTLVIAEDSVRYFGRKIHKFHNEYDIELCDCTPSHLRLMAEQTAKKLSSVKYLIVGGENLKWEILKKLRAVMGRMPVVINVYGPTECCVDVAFNYLDHIDENKSGYVSIGVPLENTELLILNDEMKIVKEKNSPGELVVKGKQVGAGYVNIQSNCFLKSDDSVKGYDLYRTGDLAVYNEDNEMIILTRVDGQVKINGYRIELDEISKCVEEIEGSHCETIVVEIKDVKKLVSFIEGDFDEEELKLRLNTHLPAYMMPKSFVCVEKIPLNKNGKVDAARLREIYCAERR